uniref:Uncharacterized protein n=1 Tax=Arundo donax TaxID=35708 RepID=A0A0A8YE34_ARUDO
MYSYTHTWGISRCAAYAFMYAGVCTYLRKCVHVRTLSYESAIHICVGIG